MHKYGLTDFLDVYVRGWRMHACMDWVDGWIGVMDNTLMDLMNGCTDELVDRRINRVVSSVS